MSPLWYLARNNREKYGPYSIDQLGQFAASGSVLPTDMLLQEGSQKWVAASSPSGPLGEDGRPMWWSVHYGAKDVWQLSVDHLLEDARGTKKCVVVSAYLVMDWFEQLLTAVPASCEVCLHLNEGELMRKPTLRRDLGERITHPSPSLRIWLHHPPGGGMFHTKLYAFNDGRAWTIWTGSANASTQGFEANEELMLRAGGTIVSPLMGYIASLEQYGKPFKDASTELQPDDVRALLLGGRMYLQRDWLSGFRLPIDARLRSPTNEEGEAPPGYVAPRRKSSFDVAAALEVTQRDKNRAQIKKLSVATCYGLWAPQALSEKIKDDRRHVQKCRKVILARVWDANAAAGESKVRQRFHDVLDYVTHKHWRDQAYRSKWKWNPDEAFRRFYERLFGRRGKLSPDLRARMADPLYSGIVPDLFSNGTEGEEFLSTFFDSLEVESYKGRSQNRIWHTIREFCDLKSQPYTADEIRRLFENQLRKRKFGENRWAKTEDTAGAGELSLDEDEEPDEEDE